MRLRLRQVTKNVGRETHLYPVDLELASGAINVLLGATLSGKTSLLRILAGLDAPSSGQILIDDRDVTGVPVRKRDVAMVYQQFINYPSLTVFENIASPLRVKKRNVVTTRSRVHSIAETLRLTPYLDRLPGELSGGQQQRVALARALAKEAELLLLDEPLVNLDYKLREALRTEFQELFKDARTTIVYATTEPAEALQLGGRVVLLEEGRVLQSGATLDVYRRPTSLAAARAFSDPPLNVFPADRLKDARATVGASAVNYGVRAHRLRIATTASSDIRIDARVALAEITGSDTFLHVESSVSPLTLQLAGVHELAIGAPCSVYMNPSDLFGFDATGQLVFAPQVSEAF